jgi:hypothetical protein
VSFAVGDYINKVDCDVLPIDACQLLLERPWQFDHDAVHAGKSNTYTFIRDGRRQVLKPMADSEIKTELQALKKMMVLKIDSKSRTVSFQGREDNTGMTPPIVDATETGPVKKSSDGKVAEKNVVHAVRFHRGNNGRPSTVWTRNQFCNW